MGANWKPRWGVALKFGTGVATIAIAIIAAVQLQQAQRESERARLESERAKLDSERAKLDSERAFRESPEGRLQEAVNRMMRPHDPAKAKEQVVARKAAVDASVVLARELKLLGYSLRSLLDNEVVGARRR